MATQEAMAIRAEKAQARMEKALGKLQAEMGAKVTTIELTEKDPESRVAELNEKLADIVESLLALAYGEEDDEFEETTTTEEVYVEETDGDTSATSEMDAVEEPISEEELTQAEAEVEAEMESSDADNDESASGYEAGVKAKKPKK